MIGTFLIKLGSILVFVKLASSSIIQFNKEQYYKSLTPEERLRIFNTDDENHIPNFEFATIDWPKQHKRSINGVYRTRLRAASLDITFNLRLITPLVGPNTPVYTIKTQNGQRNYKVHNPFTVPFSDIYEDEDYVTSVVAETLADGSKRITSGLIGSHNAVIQEASKSVQYSSTFRPPIYILHFINSLNKVLGTHVIQTPSYTGNVAPPKLPSVIYPEVLIIADYSLYNTFVDFNSFARYLMIFWNSVDFMYRPIKNPKYKLSIAGIIIGQDTTAFSFISNNLVSKSINYENTLNSLNHWLSNQNRDFLPLDSYDAVIIQTRIAATSRGSKTLGLAYVAGACNSVASGRVGIIHDQMEYSSVYTAAHELGHLLGAYHDDGCIRGTSVMASSVSPFNTGRLRWSQCALNGFGEFLKQNPQCLFNVPSHLQGLNLKSISPKYNITYDIKNKAMVFDDELLEHERDLMGEKGEENTNSFEEELLEYKKRLEEAAKRNKNSFE